jgi:hypothetical protein
MAANDVSMETTAEIQVPLSILKDNEVSFTYPDSMFCPFMLLMKQEPDVDPEYREKLFTLREMEALIESRGLPGDGWQPDLPAGLSHYIEAQAWNQHALQRYLEDAGWTA